MIHIRKATRADINSLVDFNQRMAFETEEKQLDDAVLRPGVTGVFDNDSRGFYLVAEDEQQIVGSLMVTYEWSDWRNGNFWWIQSVYVIPSARRTGVYKALYEQVKALAARQAIGYRLYVEKNNHIAQATYRSLGMSVCEYDMYEAMSAKPEQ
ncbi:MAG: GNAT family N-acetyltransferase [Gammaproteobacteria bacterium]|nr:GNAT family N-acetyltransferase [Gammaproteobacteria bacterium]